MAKSGYRVPVKQKPAKTRLNEMMASGEIHCWWAFDKDDWVITRNAEETHNYLLANNQQYRAKMSTAVDRTAVVPTSLSFDAVQLELRLVDETVKPRRTGKAELVVLSHKLLAVARAHDPALAEHADLLLAAA